MRCPWCGHPNDKVIDSRSAEGGAAIRRRRQCLKCSKRFTTFERVEPIGLIVVKREGAKEPFERAKLISGVRKAMKNRPVTEEQLTQLADRVEEKLRRKGPAVTSQEVGLEVLELLRRLSCFRSGKRRSCSRARRRGPGDPAPRPPADGATRGGPSGLPLHVVVGSVDAGRRH